MGIHQRREHAVVSTHARKRQSLPAHLPQNAVQRRIPKATHGKFLLRAHDPRDKSAYLNW
jgi:hypothetical protein